MVTFFKQRETYRLDKTRLSEYFGLCLFIGFSQNNADKSSSKEVTDVRNYLGVQNPVVAPSHPEN